MEFLVPPQSSPILETLITQVGPIAALALVATILIAALKPVVSGRRRKTYRQSRKTNVVAMRAAPRTETPAKKENDAAQSSLAALSQCNLDTRSLMSKAQARLGEQLAGYCSERNLRIHAETAMSAILSVQHPDRNMRSQGFNAISRKRVDFCLTDQTNRPVCVVEYQGGGHWTSGGAATERRDKTKRAAFAMARLPLLEVPAKWDWTDISRQLDALLSQGTAAQGFKSRFDPQEP
ncbi:DUF2726 domain-containing protein [Jannaschia seohaensis]|uniref:Uncharacterized protein DUF2726 n=1 Tax=Jannaschia seohaensis TaxID=475081 RepID=A0A2Y9C1Q3_9RHOB|nr:DUF2726 domain-containing protein [Jannaschia seohaensis]PWJ17015.1 uncharacterized protein DUF2726 [Jannaschia seohaensis]SSA48352.1 Protein of unknown function [Jannaschia seohaensis]